MTENIGPVQLATVGSPVEADCGGGILNELSAFERHKTILGLLFVSKDAETGDLLPRWGASSEPIRRHRPAATAGGKEKPKEPRG